VFCNWLRRRRVRQPTARSRAADCLPKRRIGRGDPVAWPPRSPDLTPPDFFLWGAMEELVNATPVEREDDLMARIILAGEDIRHKPGVFGRMRENRRNALPISHTTPHPPAVHHSATSGMEVFLFFVFRPTGWPEWPVRIRFSKTQDTSNKAKTWVGSDAFPAFGTALVGA